MEFDNKSSTGGYTVSSLFKSLILSSVYSNHIINGIDCVSKINTNALSYLATIKLSIEEIFQILSSLYFNPCSGPDGILNILLRYCNYSLFVPIHKLFRQSSLKGVFPFQ